MAARSTAPDAAPDEPADQTIDEPLDFAPESDADDGIGEAADSDADGEASARAPLELTDGHRGTRLVIKAFDASGRPTLLEHRFVVEAECHGWRLDRFLMKRMRRVSRTRVQRVIHGDLDVNGEKVVRPGATVKEGDVVAFRRPAPAEPEVPRHVGVLVADEVFYALDKPAGLPIHPTARYHYGTVTAVLRERFPGEKLEICHRLDRETSGALLVARRRGIGPLLKRAFARRLVEKRYLAVVHGELSGERTIDAPLGLHGERVAIKMGVVPVEQGGLPSRTRVVPLRRYRGYTLVEAHPRTGRQHQIRAHLDAIGHPIVGDKLYPDEAPFLAWADGEELDAATREKLVLPRHALHAASLRFPHPVSGETVEVESPLPEDLAAFLARLEQV